MFEYTLNGKVCVLDAEISIAQLLASLELTGKRLAVEKDGQIVPKSQHSTCRIVQDCCIEIVVAVGGG